jgi:lipopolysaccharide biosynthesis protein
LPPDRPKPLLLGFYLPQFHAIPENDQFWGKGFTEWRQIACGVSRFPGHYQPRIPRDLGFYELNNLDTFRAQADLAKAAGIQAFAFYYYWFNGKRVLERPLDTLLASSVDMPLLIIWANENWTRTWDGSETEVLLRQDYRRQDEDFLLEDLARHFLDHRYIRIAGRPLFVIYNPESIPEPASTIDRWRGIFATRYGCEPLIFMAQTFGARDPRRYACDGAIEFPPHKTAEKLARRLTPDAYSPGCASQILSYDDFVDASLNEEPPPYHLIKTAVPSWDNEARRPNRSLTLEHLSPAKYQAWLRRLILRAIEKPILGTPIVAINAWNEWAEGAYLEPDVYYGSSFLNATARAYVSAIAAHASAQSDHINRGNGR